MSAGGTYQLPHRQRLVNGAKQEHGKTTDLYLQ